MTRIFEDRLSKKLKHKFSEHSERHMSLRKIAILINIEAIITNKRS